MKKIKKKATHLSGKFIGNERGFGFVVCEEREDVFIPPHFTCGALHGDEVTVELDKKQTEKLCAGQVTQIIRRAPMFGTFFYEKNQGFVRPIEKKIPYVFHVPPKTVARFGLADGHRVIFSVDKRGNPFEKATACFVTEIVGHINDPGVDVLTLVMMADVPFEFSKEVADELENIPSEINESDMQNRLDLRNEFVFTIDGDDTKDIDDAISFSKNGDGYRLGVHIADVSHYVCAGSAIDASALNRGTSIYLADRVIPMLPHKLSSGICSLFPNADRLALSCIMNVDSNGDVTDYEITPSVICSKRRFTYNEVQEILDKGEDELINSMDELRNILRKKRDKRGALDFDFPETKIRVDENGRTVSVEAYPRTNATAIIEEFMILSNETIASHFFTKKIPFIYRTHEAPSAERLTALQETVGKIKLGKTKHFSSGAIQGLLNSVKDTPEAHAVSSAVLRALPQAQYTTTDPTHFGLASEMYCHFTSPIRRYADLQIHRIIKNKYEDHKVLRTILPEVATQCSRTERVAEALERDVADLKKVQFMADKIDKAFDAIITAVNARCIYIMLPNTVEGLIPAANLLRHRYKFNKELLTYETHRSILRTGLPVKVRLTESNEAERRLIFKLIK
ncbi:MAG: ribonuclease R [Clostridiales bacterium]|jgi:ribonuclease R|nr:ribonuclease R [Clostridiales bacterium]